MNITRHLPYILLFARQELLDRHKDSLMGVFWLFLQPLAYILIFSLVFSTLMKARLTGFENQPYAYTIYLVSGLLIWNLMANVLVQLSGVYQAKRALMQKVPVSLSLMPLYVPLTEGVIYALAMLMFALVLGLGGYAFSWHWLLIPIIAFMAMFFAYALGILLAMLSVFLPDIRTATPIVMQLLFWLTPIVYLSSLLPSSLQQWLWFSPFAVITDSLQQIVLYHALPDISRLLWLLALSLLLAGLARWMQKRLERDIRDLI